MFSTTKKHQQIARQNNCEIVRFGIQWHLIKDDKVLATSDCTHDLITALFALQRI